ncbi:MAG: Holliday junction resolvase RuvX, partial [bacterium]
YGTKRIGVAVGNRITNTSQPLRPISAQSGNRFWIDVDQLIADWKPDTLIVGLPLNLDGTQGKAALAAITFAETVESRYGLPVTMIDERLTSAEADALIRDNASKGKSLTSKRQMMRDSIAAELIIKTYLTDNPAPA